MSLAELTGVLVRSVEGATAFGRTIFPKGEVWSGERVQAFVNGVGSGTAATVGATGWPHAAWVPVRCLDGVVYLAGTPGSVFLRNAESGRLAITVCGDGHAVIGQGRCERVVATAELREAFAGLGGAGLSDEERPWLAGLVRFVPRRLFAS